MKVQILTDQLYLLTTFHNIWINSDLIYINDILNENREISQNLILDKLKYKNNWISVTKFSILDFFNICCIFTQNSLR
jgi:hypothetical protein